MTKITRDIVLKPSLSITNQQATVLVRIVHTLAPNVVPVRRPLQELPPEGRWFNGVIGWFVSEWGDRMDAWKPSMLIGYLMDALEDERNTNLNKGGACTLLSLLENETGWPFASSIGSSVDDLMVFRDDEPPLDLVPTTA